MRIYSILMMTSLLAASALIGVGNAHAQNNDPVSQNAREAAGLRWQDLSADQQQLLSGMQDQWNQLPPRRQIALANGAKRFLRMDAAQRNQANTRFEQWNNLPEAERAAIAERFAEFRKLSPQEKARIRQASRRFERMTPEQRQRLRQRFLDLSPEERARARDQLRNRPRARQSR
jgi:hypothetical protein